MDPELKAKLTHAIEAVLDEQQEAERTPDGVKVQLEEAPPKTYPDVYGFVRKRMLNARIWTDVQEAIVRVWLDEFAAEIVRRRQRSRAAQPDPAQMSLFEGFERLPQRIRAGNASVPLAKVTVAQFLEYKAAYERRAARDQEVVAELQRLVGKVARFVADEGLTVAEALERVPRLVQASESA